MNDKIDTELTDLFDILSYRRVHNSNFELEVINKYIKPLGATADPYGNYILKIGESNILWSCHTDTVHQVAGRQKLAIDVDGIVTVQPDPKGNNRCLGADDGAGLWLMQRMAKAKVPGLYIFHRNEEHGGRGSSYIAEKIKEARKENKPTMFDGIDIAIAFDRCGTDSVITYQGYRCCSDAFGNSLAKELDLGHKLDEFGVFTDTANYTEVINECTNLSVGYNNEHTKFEYLDTVYLKTLLQSLLKLDQTKLTIKRSYTEESESLYNSYIPYLGTSRMWDLVSENKSAVVEILSYIGFDEEMLETEIRNIQGYVNRMYIG